MRSIKTTVTAAALLTAGLVLTAPAAHASTAPHAMDACGTAVAAANQAAADYKAALADLKKQIADGGHPGMAEEQNVDSLKHKARATFEAAERLCGVADRDHHHRRRHPHGAMRTGVGSTSRGVDGGELAGGLGILGAAGAGALALRRRRAGSEG